MLLLLLLLLLLLPLSSYSSLALPHSLPLTLTHSFTIIWLTDLVPPSSVLLGSFSNYLVTKSSVPVMVARRKLKKHSKKYKDTNVRLSNNLLPSKGLASAKID